MMFIGSEALGTESLEGMGLRLRLYTIRVMRNRVKGVKYAGRIIAKLDQLIPILLCLTRW